MLAQQINKYLLCERHKYLRSGGEIRFKNIASALLAIKNDGGFAWRNLFFLRFNSFRCCAQKAHNENIAKKNLALKYEMMILEDEMEI